MTTPFSFKQVFGSLLHWLHPRPKSKATPAEIVQTGDFCIDLRSREVTVRGKEVELTQEELDLLVFLTTHPKKVVTPSTRLLTKARGNRVRQTQFLRVLLQLCRKIEPEASSHHYIQTEPWVFTASILEGNPSCCFWVRPCGCRRERKNDIRPRDRCV